VITSKCKRSLSPFKYPLKAITSAQTSNNIPAPTTAPATLANLAAIVSAAPVELVVGRNLVEVDGTVTVEGGGLRVLTGGALTNVVKVVVRGGEEKVEVTVVSVGGADPVGVLVLLIGPPGELGRVLWLVLLVDPVCMQDVGQIMLE
jgi:hypothetical protein